MTPPEACIVIDMGGSSLRVARYVRDRRALEGSLTTDAPVVSGAMGRDGIRTFRRALDDIDRMTRSLCNGEVRGVVSVAFCGPIDGDGAAFAAPTLCAGQSVSARLHVRDELRGLWPNADVIVMNDVTAAGYRYVTDGCSDFCIVTVSSGIGHKIFAGGRPLLGPRYRGGEMGHVRVDWTDDAPVCDCGGVGHLGAIASGRGVERAARISAARDVAGFRTSSLSAAVAGDPSRVDNRRIAEAFRAGDAWTSELVARCSAPLARMLATLHALNGVERFVIIGGFALSLGERYVQILVREASQTAWNLGQRWEEMIELAAVPDVGLIGAGRYATEVLAR